MENTKDGAAIFVAVCGRVERVDVPDMTLEALCAAVSARFDIGGRLRFVSDEENEPEVTSDEQLQHLAGQRQTVRVLVGDSALADLEQRMWQLRQLQWGFFQDELSRVKTNQMGQKNESRQLRQALEQSARREVELTGELMNERRLREASERSALERHEAVIAELRREQRSRETMEAKMQKDIEEARQSTVRLSAQSERQVTELKSALVDESRARGKNIEALLSEWAGSQAEIRQALDGVRTDIERSMQDSERQAKGLLREASAREAFEQFFGEKIRAVELAFAKVEGSADVLDRKLSNAVEEAAEATRAEAAERAAGDQELQWVVSEMREKRGASGGSVMLAGDNSASPGMSQLNEVAMMEGMRQQPQVSQVIGMATSPVSVSRQGRPTMQQTPIGITTGPQQVMHLEQGGVELQTSFVPKGMPGQPMPAQAARQRPSSASPMGQRPGAGRPTTPPPFAAAQPTQQVFRRGAPSFVQQPRGPTVFPG